MAATPSYWFARLGESADGAADHRRRICGEHPQLLLGAEVVVSLPRAAKPPAHGGAVALGQVLEDVSLLVALMPTSA